MIQIFQLLSIAREKAALLGGSVLHIHALTEAMDNTCLKIGLKSRTKRSVFVVPGNCEKDLGILLSEP